MQLIREYFGSLTPAGRTVAGIVLMVLGALLLWYILSQGWGVYLLQLLGML